MGEHIHLYNVQIIMYIVYNVRNRYDNARVRSTRRYYYFKLQYYNSNGV